MKKLYLILLGIGLFVGFCKPKQEVKYESTEINLEIVDNENKKLDGVRVAIFTDSLVYGIAKNSGDWSKCLDSSIAINGSVGFKTTLSNSKYYVLATYRNKENGLSFNNFEDQFVLSGVPGKGALIKGKVVLQPSDAVIVFYTSTGNKISPAIDIKLDKESYQLTKTITTKDVKGTEENVLRISVNPGTKNYYAKGANGCLWTGSVKVSKGNLSLVELISCTTSKLTFWTEDASKLPLTIILNEKDTLGILNNTRIAEPNCDDTQNVVTVYREAGEQIYSVYSADKKTVWVDKVILNSAACKVVKIAKAE